MKMMLKPGEGRRVLLPGGRTVSDAGEEIEVDMFVQRRIDDGDLVPVEEVGAALSRVAADPLTLPSPRKERV